MRTKILLLGLTILLIALLFPGSALGWLPHHGYGPPSFWTHTSAQSLHIEHSADADAYHLLIHLVGITPQAVNVRLEGMRWLYIGIDQSTEASYSNDGRDGYGYFRGFSYSSNSQSRRIGLPRDANGMAMQREDGKDRIHIRIPRRR